MASTARPGPPRVGSREVEEFERAAECGVEAHGTACLMRANGAIDFTANIRELLQERKGVPAFP